MSYFGSYVEYAHIPKKSFEGVFYINNLYNILLSSLAITVSHYANFKRKTIVQIMHLHYTRAMPVAV